MACLLCEWHKAKFGHGLSLVLLIAPPCFTGEENEAQKEYVTQSP